MTAATPNPPTSRRSRLFRVQALAWAVVFLFSGVRPAFAAGCPHHVTAAPETGAVADGNGSAAAHHGHADHSGHAGHGSHAAGSPHAGEPGTDPGAHHDFCTCVGPCQAPGAVPLPATSWTDRAGDAPYEVSAPRALRAEVLPGRDAYTLPFATAPPRSCG